MLLLDNIFLFNKMAKMCVSFIFALLVALVSSNSVPAPPYFLNRELTFTNYDDLYQDSPTMPDACDSDSYCFVKGNNYPDKDIKELLEDMRSLIVETPVKRVGDRSGDNNLDCPSTIIAKPIYYITDENDKVRVVVQSEGKFEQIYTVTKCTYEGPITRTTSNLFVNKHAMETFKPECVTTKMDVNFFVLSDEKDDTTNKYKIEIAKAKGGIPVCCKCQLNFDS